MTGAVRVEGRGRTLLPGLIDCHVHLGGGDGAPPWAAKVPNVDAQAAALLFAGVTTILSAALDSDTRDLQARIARGALAGPRIISSSRSFTAEGGHPVPFFKSLLPWPVSSAIVRGRVVQVAGEATARAQVAAEIADTDPRFVKIMYDDIPPGTPHLTFGQLKAIIAEVRDRGRRASVHVGSVQDALEAVEAGAALLMHLPGDDLLTEAQARALVASGVPMVTTLRIYQVLSAAMQRGLSFTALEREVMPPGAAGQFQQPPPGYQVPGFPPGYLESFPARDAQLRANAKLLLSLGARLVAGTDSGLPAVFHGAALHRELQALVALGVPPARALRMATADAAQVLEPGADFGTIVPGQRADLLLVEGDPLADIAATERIAGVWQDGRAVARQRP